MLNPYLYDFFVAFITFALVRYTLPNMILGKEVSLWSGFVLSLFYAICAFIRSYSKVFN